MRWYDIYVTAAWGARDESGETTSVLVATRLVRSDRVASGLGRGEGAGAVGSASGRRRALSPVACSRSTRSYSCTPTAHLPLRSRPPLCVRSHVTVSTLGNNRVSAMDWICHETASS